MGEAVKHRDLIDLIEGTANAVRVALIEGDDAAALDATHRLNIAASELTRALYDDAATGRACSVR